MTGPEMAICMPDHIHWFSQLILDYYLTGQISTQEFMRWFHMPNSEYLMMGDCIAQIVDPDYVPEADRPQGIKTGATKKI